jgi:hypothetical protein
LNAAHNNFGHNSCHAKTNALVRISLWSDVTKPSNKNKSLTNLIWVADLSGVTRARKILSAFAHRISQTMSPRFFSASGAAYL